MICLNLIGTPPESAYCLCHFCQTNQINWNRCIYKTPRDAKWFTVFSDILAHANEICIATKLIWYVSVLKVYYLVLARLTERSTFNCCLACPSECMRIVKKEDEFLKLFQQALRSFYLEIDIQGSCSRRQNNWFPGRCLLIKINRLVWKYYSGILMIPMQ